MKLKRILAALAVGTLALGIFGCGGSEKAADTSAPVKVGVTAGPHAEIMDEVKKLAAKDGLNIEVVEFNDFVTPNIALQQGEIFANSMQHRPYLDATLKKEPGFELVEVFKTVNFPMAVYSDKIKKGEAIPDDLLRPVSIALNKRLNGRGGGAKGFVQGSWKADETAVREAVAAVWAEHTA